MANIFELLNNVEAVPAEDLDASLTKDEQDKIFQMILGKDKRKHGGNKSIKMTLASAAALAIIISCTLFKSDINAMAEKIVNYFTGNTVTDYAEEVHEIIDQTNGTMELLSIFREGSQIHLKVKFDFTEDVTELTNLCGEYKLPGLTFTDGKVIMDDGTVIEENCTVSEDGYVISEDGTTMYDSSSFEDDFSNYNEPERYVLFAPPFVNSCILVNNVDYMKESESRYEELRDFPISLISVRNSEISGSTLIQDVVLYLQDEDYQEDINISFRYKDIELTDTTIEGEWNLDYIISGKDYEEIELNKMPINLSATDFNGSSYTLDSYSVTPAGIKIYGQDNSEDISEDIISRATVRINAYDDLGNQYLMYPIYDSDTHHKTYTIYNGPADTNNGYLDFLDSNAKTLTIAFEQLKDIYDENGNYIEEQASIISDELTLQVESEIE